MADVVTRRSGCRSAAAVVAPLSLSWEVAAGAGARMRAVLGVAAVPSVSEAARSFAASIIAELAEWHCADQLFEAEADDVRCGVLCLRRERGSQQEPGQ